MENVLAKSDAQVAGNTQTISRSDTDEVKTTVDVKASDSATRVESVPVSTSTVEAKTVIDNDSKNTSSKELKSPRRGFEHKVLRLL